MKWISQHLNYSYDGIRRICRLYRQGGEANLRLNYQNCGLHKIHDNPKLWSRVRQMLQANDELGAPIIRSKLIASGRFDLIPHERTIQRWMKAEGYAQARGRRPKSKEGYTRQVHHTWQVDGKENVKLASGEKTCYLSIADEGSASFLKGHVFGKKNT